DPGQVAAVPLEVFPLEVQLVQLGPAIHDVADDALNQRQHLSRGREIQVDVLPLGLGRSTEGPSGRIVHRCFPLIRGLNEALHSYLTSSTKLASSSPLPVCQQEPCHRPV